MSDHIQVRATPPHIRYISDGKQQGLIFPFCLFHAEDLAVYVDGVRQSGGYDVLGAGESDGGRVIFADPPAAGAHVMLRRQAIVERTTDFQDSGIFRARVINDELDYLTAAVQQVEAETARSLRLHPADTDAALVLPSAAERAGRVIAFDEAGDVTTVPATPGGSAPATLDDVAEGLSNKHFTLDEKAKLATIATAADVNPPKITAEERVAATEAAPRTFSPDDVRSVVFLHAPVPAVTSVHGRIGQIVAQSGDYGADQIVDTAEKVMMTAVERQTLGDLADFAAAHAGANAHSSDAIRNDSAVAGATVSDALDGLQATMTAPSAWQEPVIARLAVPPAGSIAAGSRYLVASSPGGAWTGHAEHIAVWNGTSWAFLPPSPGWVSFVVAEALQYRFGPDAWCPLTIAPATLDEVAEGLTNKHFTLDEKAKLATIATAADVNPPKITAEERVAATEVAPRTFSPDDVRSMVVLHAPVAAVTSVHGRIGQIVAQSGDYGADQIVDTAEKVMMTAVERQTLGDLADFAAAHAGDNAHGSDAIRNDSAVAGATVSDALDGLQATMTAPSAWQEPVIARLALPPSGLIPAGSRYLVASSPGGAWTGHAEHITVWNGTSWAFVPPSPGWALFVVAEALQYRFGADTWDPITADLPPSLLYPGAVDVTSAPYNALCNGTVDDASAIAAAAAAIRAAGLGSVLVIPRRTRIGRSLDLSGLNIEARGDILMTHGTTLTLGGTATSATPLTISLNVRIGDNDFATARTTPFLRIAGKQMQVKIGKCPYVQVFADGSIANFGSTAYNDFFISHCRKLELIGLNGSSSTGWINENRFYGGRLVELIIEGNGYKHNNNYFHGCTLEPWGDTLWSLTIRNAHSNVVYGRFEGDGSISMDAATSFNEVVRTYNQLVDKTYEQFNFPQNWIGSSGTFSDLGVNNSFRYSATAALGYAPELLGTTVAQAETPAWTWMWNTGELHPVEAGDVVAVHLPKDGAWRVYMKLYDRNLADLFTSADVVASHAVISPVWYAWSATATGWEGNCISSTANHANGTRMIQIASATAKWIRVGVRTGSIAATSTEGARIVIYRRTARHGITMAGTTTSVIRSLGVLSGAPVGTATRTLRLYDSAGNTIGNIPLLT